MLIGIVIELAWALPLIALNVLILNLLSNLRPTKPVALAVALGATLGIAYAVTISLLAGPMVSTAAIPLLPFMATVGASTGLLRNSESWRESVARQRIYIFLVIVVLLWSGYFALRNNMASANSSRLVVVKLNALSEPLHWDDGNGSISLNDVERRRVEEAIGITSSGILEPVLSLSRAQHPNGTAILVMIRDVSQRVQLPMPDAGIAIFTQNQDGTWREDSHDAHFGKNSLSLLPAPGSNFTRIEIEGPFDTQASEIGISHK